MYSITTKLQDMDITIMNKIKFYTLCILFLIICTNLSCVAPEVIKTSYSDITDYFYKAEHHYKKEEHKQARYFYELFIRESLDDTFIDKAYYNLGKIYFLEENYRKALLNFRKLIYKYPKNELVPDAKYYTARCFYLLKDYNRAIRGLLEYQNNFPNSTYDPEIRIMLTESFRESGEYLKSKDMANSILILYPNTKFKYEALYQLASTEIKLNELGSALAHYRESLNGDITITSQLKIQKAFYNLYLEEDNNFEASKMIADIINREMIEDEENQNLLYSELTDILKNKLTINELKMLVTEFPTSFPADIAILEISDRFYNEGNIYNACLWWRRFIQTFPDHEKNQLIQSKLAEVSSLRVMDEIKIGCIAPMTEEFGGYGEKMVMGIKVAIEQYNKTHEKKATLVLVDSKGKPMFARQGVDVLTNQEDIIAIIGPLLSESTKFAAQLAEQLQVPLITPTAGSDGICETGRFIFRNCLTSKHQAFALADYAVNTLGLIDYGILFPFNPIGQKLMILFADHIEKLGADVHIIEFYDQEDTDFKNQILRIHETNPEAIFIPSDHNKAVLIAPQVPFYKPEPVEDEEDATEDISNKEKKINNIITIEDEITEDDREDGVIEDDKNEEIEDTIQLIGTDGWYNQQLIVQGEKYVEGSICSVGFFPYAKREDIKDFVYNFNEKYHMIPDLISAQSYEATQIILHTIDSGAITRDEIRQGFTQIENFKGICGTVGFDPSGESEKEVSILKVRRRRFIEIYP